MTEPTRNTPDTDERAPKKYDSGVLRVTSGSLKIPDGIDAQEGKTRLVDPVVVVVLGLAVAFTLFIAWLVHGGQ